MYCVRKYISILLEIYVFFFKHMSIPDVYDTCFEFHLESDIVIELDLSYKSQPLIYKHVEQFEIFIAV